MIAPDKKGIAKEDCQRVKQARLILGVTLVFVAIVVGPFVLTVVPRGLYLASVGTAFPSPWEASTVGAVRWLKLLAPPLSITYAVGIYYLTSDGRRNDLSDGLRGAARLFGVAYALMTSLTAFTYLHEDFAAYYNVLGPIRYHMEELAALVSMIVAVRHFAACGARWAEFATLGLAVALVGTAAWLLGVDIRIPRNAYIQLWGLKGFLMEAWFVALWLGQLAVLWQLRRVLQRAAHGGFPAPEQAALDGRGPRVMAVSGLLRDALRAGVVLVPIAVFVSVLRAPAAPAPKAAPAPSAPPSVPCAPCAPPADPCAPTAPPADPCTPRATRTIL